jgi:hypothetical protein
MTNICSVLFCICTNLVTLRLKERTLGSVRFVTLQHPFSQHSVLLIRHETYGPGSVVGIATAYGLDGPGIESWWGRDFPHLSRSGLRPTQPPVQWVPGLSRG